jgi:hypothetical protein
VTAGLLILHADRPQLLRVDEAVFALVVLRSRCHEPRDEPLAQEPLRRVAAVRVEAEAHHRAPVHHHVRDNGEDARRHGGEVDIGIGDVGLDRGNDVPDGDDAHG